MVVRILLFKFLLLFNLAFCQAQPNSIQDTLRTFLIEADELDKNEQTDLLIKHALDFSEFDMTKEGIYKFSVFASHARPYLFIYEQNQITILREYSVANVLKKIAPYFERNDSALSQKAKLKYLQNIVDILQDNYLPPGWEEMPENFQIPDSLKQ